MEAAVPKYWAANAAAYINRKPLINELRIFENPSCGFYLCVWTGQFWQQVLNGKYYMHKANLIRVARGKINPANYVNA